ncbi:unnamed protein product [Phyllotreta striolata]|uniref:R3H domain-containing protein n=1 Tax=Phyllotreta striolata TaxID=444603 RepID=A0A9N9XJ88_PHYSR|nr:unnamed protein product [Phyllotreta striolata]
MTVIKEKPNYKYPSPNSASASDTESLHLGSLSASDAESADDESVPNRIRIIRPKLVKISQVEEHINVKRNSGKKKLRRYQNRCSLQTLSEEDEAENMVVIMDTYKGPFERLLDDKAAFDYWQKFIEKPEEEQNEIIEALSEKYPNETEVENIKTDVPGRISSRIKRTFKIKKNLSLKIVQVCENDLIEFFKATPEERYIKIPPTSFDRLVIHAIAQYHRLKSISYVLEEGNRKSVEVYNVFKNWTPANCYLTDFIRHLRNV